MITNFSKDIVLVAIPVVVASILVPKITHNWQIHSAKIITKKEILATFGKSAIRSKNLLHQFLGIYLRTYGSTTAESYDEGTANYDLVIPTEGDERPSIKLKKEFEEVLSEVSKTKLNDEPFLIAMLRLYYRDEEIIEEYTEIQKRIGYLKTLVIELIEHKEMGKLQTLGNDYTKKLEELNDKLKKFSKKIIEKDITV